MHFDFVFMHHLLGPCVMQLISRFNRRFGVIERCCHDRVVTKEPWTTRRRTPVVAVVMLLHTTLGSKWNPSMVAQPVSNHRLTHPRVRAGLMTPPLSEHLGRSSSDRRSSISARSLLQRSLSARLLPRDVAQPTQAAHSSMLSAAGASAVRTRQACRRE